jgi:hypothetical protein
MPKRLGERKSLLAIGILGLSLVMSVAFLANVAHAAASTSTTTTASSTNSAQPCTGLGTPQEDGDCQGTGQYGDQTGADTLAELPEIEG